MKKLLLLSSFVLLGIGVFYFKYLKVVKSKKNILVVVATKSEGFEDISRLSEKFENFNIQLLYTDVGLANAAYSTTREIYKYKLEDKKIDYIINLGSAGGRGNNIKVNDTVECEGFIARDADLTGLGVSLGIMNPDSIFEDDRSIILKNNATMTNLPRKICCSGNNFETKEVPFKECEVVEMEAAIIAKVALRENIKFVSIKYISDVLNKEIKNHNEGDEWKNNVTNTSKVLLSEFEKILHKIQGNKC